MNYAIESFRGDYYFLSNFYPSPVDMDGLVYPSVENAFQASKTMFPDERKKFIGISPNEAKRLGRCVNLRQDWDLVKYDIMASLVRKKFEDPGLRQRILNTRPLTLIEGNTWGDTIWGVCRGKGQNRLGQILMQVREEIFESQWSITT